MKFDEILENVGEFGPYQKRVFFLVCLPAVMCGIQMMSSTFIYDIPDYRCAIPGYPHDTYKIQNEVHAQLINYTIPPGNDDDGDEGVYSSCDVYNTEHNTTNTSVLLDAMHYVADNPRNTMQCSRHVFDKTEMKSTIVTEFDLVCGLEVMRAHSNSLSFVGSLTGSVAMGALADIFGRKIAIMVALILQIVFGLVTYLSPSIYAIIGIRIIGGVSWHALYAIPATTGIELVGPNKRSFTGTAIEFFWAAGIFLVLPIAYFLRDWRDMQLVITLLTVPLLALWWLIPESPRWLLDKGRISEAEVILKKICKSNKCELPPGALEKDPEEKGHQIKMWSMFTNKVLIVRNLIIFFNWLAVNLFYYGLSLNMTNLEGDPYINYMLSVIVEIIAYTFCIIIVPHVGRRKLHFILITTGGLALLAVIPVQLTTGNVLIINILAQVGKFCASSCYTIVYILSAELFPTVLRNSGIGLCSIFEGFGGIMAPYIADLGLLVPGPLGKSLSMVVFGGISILAGGLSLLLPETLNRKLPETIQDAIDFDKPENKRPSNKEYEMAPVLES